MEVTVKIFRYNPEKDQRGNYVTYKREADENDRVLDVLEYIIGKTEFYKDNTKRYNHKQLWLAPFSLRKNLKQAIEQEIKNAHAKKTAWIFLKLNSLVDEDIITLLYNAGNAGVKIRLIIRGICSLIPGVKGMSENIEVISIIDRFLETCPCVHFLQW